MGLPNSGDIQKSVDRLRRYYTIEVPLGGTLAAQDYLGSTSGDAGVQVPQGTLESVDVTLSAADDGNTTVQIDNETQDNNVTFDLENDSYTSATPTDGSGNPLYFSEGDELSVSVSSVNTPGDGLSAILTIEVGAAPMN